MKVFICIVLLFTVSIKALAQNPDYTLRTAWHTQNGSARLMGIGGVMGSLGGDISSNHINPAGIGLYKTKEFVLSPGFSNQSNQFKYRGNDSASTQNNFRYGTSGFIFGNRSKNNNKWTSTAVAITVNQMANYGAQVQFQGFNNVSSFTEQYLEELIRDGADTNAALSNYIFGSSLAFRTYLIDTIRGPGGSVAGYQSLVPISTGIQQAYNAATSGSMNEVAIGFAGNLADQLYVGGSINLPIIGYRRNLTYSETDATSNTANQFKSFSFKESFRSQGFGIGIKMGFIYRPQESLRLGFAFHSPQLISFKDEVRAEMIANTETYAGLRSETSDALNNNNPGQSSYTMITPWRSLLSASYVFGETDDIHQQRGFVSADIEYVHYRGARFNAPLEADQSLKDYYTEVNNVIKDIYKGNFNFRLGGELKFNTLMLRMGGAFYGKPYNNGALKANNIMATAGIGYRNYGMFVDIAYAHRFLTDVQFPYRLNDKANTYATQKSNIGNLMLTIGFKF